MHLTRFLLTVFLTAPILAELPYADTAPPEQPGDYAAWLFLDGSGRLPVMYDPEESWWLTDARSDDPLTMYNPQEFYGVRGMSINRAWEVSTGRPDVAIAIIDSGIRWNQTAYCALLRKFYLNRAELPMPQGGPNLADTRFDGYDVNGDGIFNVEDYWSDPAVSDVNGNSWIDPEDLILLFSDGVDGDGNGYVDDISGWDFFENDNNPQDDTNHGHGTNQASYAAAEAVMADEPCPANAAEPFPRDPGTCPNCMIVPLRYADSFIGDANHFAEAVVYAVDNGIDIVECAAGTLNHTSFAQDAIDYAWRNGVVINISAADEAAAHQNWPAAYEHTVVHNSIKSPVVPGTTPESYLYVNGCTNYGSYLHVAIPSTRCSSQATGLASGVSGLLLSAAHNAVDRGDMTMYLRDDGSSAAYPLSSSEMSQLWRLAADDIDFSSGYPEHAFSGIWEEMRPDWWLSGSPAGENHFEVGSPVQNLLGVATSRYRSGPGWDYFTGYGRINAARLVRYIGLERETDSREFLPGRGPYGMGHDANLSAQDRIPPEADILTPLRMRQYGHAPDFKLLQPDDPANPDVLVVTGRAAANRVTAAGGRFDFILEWAPGPQGPPAPEAHALAAPGSEERSPGPWYTVTHQRNLEGAYVGELGRISIGDIATVLASTPSPFAITADPISPFESERYAVRLRLRVIAHPANPADSVNNEAVFQKQVHVYPAAETVVRNDLGLDGALTGGAGSPSFHDLDGDGRDELLLPTDDGLIHAFVNLETGTQLPGWPVSTLPAPGFPTGNNAYGRGELTRLPRSSLLFGTVAVADLDDDGSVEVIAADHDGRLYAWQVDGSLRTGFPVETDPAYSVEPPCGPDNIPICDDYAPNAMRDEMNDREKSFYAAPAIGDLDPTQAGLEIVASAADGHIYAWHQDGRPVDGWPVLLRDPQKIASMDPLTHAFVYHADSDWLPGNKGITSPALGDIDGDGFLEVVVTINEQYLETPNVAFGDSLILVALNLAGESGNGRIYALEHTGHATAETPQSLATPHLHDQAYAPGWPVALAILAADLLPTAGQGSTHQPVLADLDEDGTLEIISATHFGPGYLLDHDGSSYLGNRNDLYRALDRDEDSYGSAATADDGPGFPAFSGISVGKTGPDEAFHIAAGSAGIDRLLDLALAGHQYSGEDHLAIWRTDGTFADHAPIEINDLQFFTTPLFADATGDGIADVIHQSAFHDLVIADGIGDGTTTRYHTGGWHLGSAAIGRCAHAGTGRTGPPSGQLLS